MNRRRKDEENAVDIKHCLHVTIRGNKFFRYSPARPLASDRSPHGDAIVVHSNALGEAAARILVERNRLFGNSRGINVSSNASFVVIRRNLVFDAKVDRCGVGAGIVAGATPVELYHNTLDSLPGPTTSPGNGCPHNWSTSERAAIRLTSQSSVQKPVFWNNVVAHAQRHLSVALSPSVLDAKTNVFDSPPVGGAPANSLIGDPMFVTDPANNDYYTKSGSPTRDTATLVPPSVKDPASYCDDPNDADALAEPDIGFLESCF